MAGKKQAPRQERERRPFSRPMRYDQRTGRELEEYPDLMARPVYTPAGERVMLTVEDACPHGEGAEGSRCIDCGSCRHYRQAPGTLVGVCGHPALRRES